jgi:hypothetical protein
VRFLLATTLDLINPDARCRFAILTTTPNAVQTDLQSGVASAINCHPAEWRRIIRRLVYSSRSAAMGFTLAARRAGT